MKRILIMIAALLLLVFLAATLGVYLWIDHDVRKNIAVAKSKYPGEKAEDALIDFLTDTTNSPQDRSQIAVWTLGQIKSVKAVPVMRKLYRNDPEGKTCFGHHDAVICQYELYKALNASESNWWPLHARLNK